jgi:peptidoglycan/LPS O-acetylase OafA/YrhL
VAPLFVRWPWKSLLAAAAIAAGWRWLALNELDFLVELFMKLGARAGVPEKAVRHLLETQLPAWSLHFALGILAGRAWMLQRGRIREGLARWTPTVVAGAAILALYAILANGTSFLGAMGWVAFPVLIATAMAAMVSWHAPGFTRLVASWPFAALGRISYSAYLYHLPVLILFNLLLPAASGWIAFPLWLAIVLAVSSTSYGMVEVPYLARARST